VCRQVRADPNRCPELAALVEHWDGQFTVLMRKRAARHIESCVLCEEQRARMVRPAALLGSVPLTVPAPVWLRKSTLFHAGNVLPPAGSPVPTPSGSHPSAHPGSQPDARGVDTGSSHATDASWWPSHDLDTSDLPDQPSAPSPAGESGRRSRNGRCQQTGHRDICGVTSGRWREWPRSSPQAAQSCSLSRASIRLTRRVRPATQHRRGQPLVRSPPPTPNPVPQLQSGRRL
jgi:hypothetical protein